MTIKKKKKIWLQWLRSPWKPGFEPIWCRVHAAVDQIQSRALELPYTTSKTIKKKKKKKSQKLNFNKIICIKELYGVPWALPFTIRSTCQHRNPCYSKPWEGKLICGNREVHTQEADFFIFGQLYCQNFLFSSGK